METELIGGPPSFPSRLIEDKQEWERRGKRASLMEETASEKGTDNAKG